MKIRYSNDKFYLMMNSRFYTLASIIQIIAGLLLVAILLKILFKI